MSHAMQTPVAVLVIDDEHLVRDTMCELLERDGYAPAGFADPMAALASLAGVAYRLALVDLSMPAMDGIRFVEAALTIRPGLGCVIVTGEGDRASSQKAVDAGAVDYLLKPFDIVAVRSALQRALWTVELRSRLADADQKVRQYAAEMALLNRQLVIARTGADLANEAKSRFVTSMGRQMRSPLNAIMGFAHILQSEDVARNPPQVEQVAMLFKEEARQLLALLDDVGDMTDLECGKLALQAAEVTLPALLDGCHAQAVRMCTARDVALDWPEPTGCAVFADAARVRQIVMALLAHAVRSSQPGGRIAVAVAELPTAEMAIAIAYAGEPTTADMLLRTPLAGHGTGQPGVPVAMPGLVLVGRLAHLMNGRIALDGGDGQTTTLTLVLPTAAAPDILQ